MTRRALTLVIAGAAAFGPGCGPVGAAETGQLSESVVYGADDRRELYQAATEELRRFGEQSVAALIDDDLLAAQGQASAHALFQMPSWAERRKLCEDVRFAQQPAAAACSGVLVAADLLLTAGHCARNLNCETTSVVFGYRYGEGNSVPTLTSDDVYRCAEVVSYEIPNAFGELDYGWLRLDRAVSSAQRPAMVARAAEPVDRAKPLHAFGFGGGVPLKIQDIASVADPRSDSLDYFTLAVDAFEGDSGGPVIQDDGSVVGVIAHGNADYVESPSRGCSEIAELPDSAAGERVTYSFQAVAGLCRTRAAGMPLCGDREPSAPGPGCSIARPIEASHLPTLIMGSVACFACGRRALSARRRRARAKL